MQYGQNAEFSNVLTMRSSLFRVVTQRRLADVTTKSTLRKIQKKEDLIYTAAET